MGRGVRKPFPAGEDPIAAGTQQTTSPGISPCGSSRCPPAQEAPGRGGGNTEQEEIHPNLETSAAAPAPGPPARRAGGGRPAAAALAPLQALRGREQLGVSAWILKHCAAGNGSVFRPHCF